MRSQKLAGGIAVVLIGLMFLLANSGLLDLGAWWLVLRFWPVALILAGLVVLAGLSFRWFAVVLLLAMIVVGVFGGPWLESLPEGRLTTEVFAPEEASAPVTSIVADLTMDAPRLRLADPVDQPYRLELSYRNIRPPTHSFTAGDDGRGLLTLDQRGRSSAAGVRQVLLLAFSPDAELDLRFSVGATQGDLDLSKYRLRRLAIDGGALQVSVRLGATPGRATVDASAGAGSFSFAVPRDVGLRVSADFGVGVKQLSAAGLRQVAGRWEDELFATADSTVEIRVSAGVGRISVTRY